MICHACHELIEPGQLFVPITVRAIEPPGPYSVTYTRDSGTGIHLHHLNNNEGTTP